MDTTPGISAGMGKGFSAPGAASKPSADSSSAADPSVEISDAVKLDMADP